MDKVIGIDVSKASFDVACFENNSWKHAIYTNDEAGFKKLATDFGGHCCYAMEASGPYYLKLAMYLHSCGNEVSVINPLMIKRYSQMRFIRAKTDKKDAQTIAEYAFNQNPELWHPADHSMLRMQQILTVLDGLQKQKTQSNNQLESIRSSGVINDSVLNSLESVINHIEKQIGALEKELDELVKDNCAETVNRIETIPGVGRKTAVLLTVVAHNFTRFSNYKQLIAYIGFSPRIFQSGTSVRGKNHICKMGNGHLRKLLYMCSWSAKRCNPTCNEMYNRLKAKGKPEKVIKVAIANKLIRQAFAIATNNREYQPNYINPKFAF